ncbi:MAG: hypothetical protein DRP87_10820 [Spirochaetes bacterium]|nr:MAG: hypothetical protein DRP87_10820 [Spirochaetota bacterium]
MKIHKHIVFFLLIVISAPAHTVEVDDFDLYMKITGLRTDGAPEIFKNWIIFTYRPDQPVRFVGASFSDQDFRKLHSFVKNEHGVYVLPYPLPSGVETLFYRLVVDGLWIKDPNNSSTARDRYGVELSVIEIPPEPEELIESPEILSDGRVRFYFQDPQDQGKSSPPSRTVFLTGSFNRWDPFMYKLKQIKPGIYSITVELLPGRHFYYFISDGRKVLDPLNHEIATDPSGKKVSMFKF